MDEGVRKAGFRGAKKKKKIKSAKAQAERAVGKRGYTQHRAARRTERTVLQGRLLLRLDDGDAFHKVFVAELRGLSPQGEHAGLHADRLKLGAVEVQTFSHS